jgi:hypothetical protein
VTQAPELRIGPWATKTSDRIWRTLRRRRLDACEHLVDAAIGADLDADLERLAGEDGGAGVALIPTPSICAAHRTEVRCPDCLAAHIADTHNPAVPRCDMCGGHPALVRRHVDVVVLSPVRIHHHAVAAGLGGALRLAEAMVLCDACEPLFPQSGLAPLAIDPFPDPARWPWPGSPWSAAGAPPPWPPRPRKDP